MKKYIFLILLAGMCGADAASITVGKGFGDGVNVLTTTGSVSKDFSFAIGTFDVEPRRGSTFAQVMAAFKEFSRTSSPFVHGANTLIAFSGSFTSEPVNAVDFNGKPIYIVVATNNLAETPETNYAVIKGLNPAAGKWVFPPNVAIADSGDAPMWSAASFTASLAKKSIMPVALTAWNLLHWGSLILETLRCLNQVESLCLPVLLVFSPCAAADAD